MTVTNPPKALIALVALICITVLRALDKLDQASFNAIGGLIVGYAVGNGVAARKGDSVDPIIGARRDRN
jgi:hypothetical protein